MKKKQSIYSWRNFVANLTGNRPEHKIGRIMLFLIIAGTVCFVLSGVMRNGWFLMGVGIASFLIAILSRIKWRHELRTFRESINKTSLSS